MINKTSYLLFLLLLAVVFPAELGAQNKKVKGNDQILSVTRETGDYDEVSLEGFMDVRLISGQEGKLTVEGEENLLEYIETEVQGDRLKIAVKRGVQLNPSAGKTIRITVPFSSLKAVQLTGSGDISSEKPIITDAFEVDLTGSGDIRLPLQTEQTSLALTGSGNITLTGSANDFVCKLTGSGDVKAFDFKCQSVRATLTGSGDIEVYASEELKASVPGAGDITYRGNPEKEDFSTLGVGSITKD